MDKNDICLAWPKKKEQEPRQDSEILELLQYTPGGEKKFYFVFGDFMSNFCLLLVVLIIT